MHKIYYLTNQEMKEITKTSMYYPSYLYIDKNYLAIKEIRGIIRDKDKDILKYHRHTSYILMNAYYENTELHIKEE